MVVTTEQYMVSRQQQLESLIAKAALGEDSE